jgi:hypothetical protein
MVNKQLSVLIAAIILLCLSINVFAENDRVRIHLKDGTVVEGELITFNEQSYRVKVGEDIQDIPWDQIDKIDIVPQNKVPPAQPSDRPDPQPVSPTAPARSGPASPTKTAGTTIPTIIDSIGQRFMTYPHKELLVVWIIDDSPSLQDEREIIGSEIDNLIFALKNKKILNMAVVGFGTKAQMKCQLSRDSKRIKTGIMQVGTEGSGTENCMAAIDYAAKIFMTASWKKIFIVITDEAGDDTERLEQVLAQLKKSDIAIYLLSAESTFAQPYSTETYTSKDGKTESASINSGIESISSEILNRTYGPIPLYAQFGSQGALKSGFPAYALNRLCDQTKGCYYFLKDSAYDRKIMESYKPDLCSAGEYNTLIKKDPLRAVVTDIKQKFEDYQLSQWFRDIEGQFNIPLDAKESLIQARDAMPKIDNYIKQLESALPTTPSKGVNKRWLANAELLRAQLYRGQYFLNQYILTVDEWIKSKDFFNPPLGRETSTHYAGYYYITDEQGAPVRENAATDKKPNYLDLAQKALSSVSANHPNTPWSMVAMKCLTNDWGYKIRRVDGYEKSKAPPTTDWTPPKKY